MKITPVSGFSNELFTGEQFDARRFYESLSEEGKERLQKTLKTYQELRNKEFSRPNIEDNFVSTNLDVPKQEDWFSRNKNILIPTAGVTVAGLLAYLLYKHYISDKSNKTKTRKN